MGPFLTADEVAAASGGRVGVGDPRIPVLLEAATAAIRAICGWHVAPVLTETQVLDGTGGALMYVHSGHIRSVTSLVVDGVQLVEGRDFGWSQLGMIELYGGRRFPRRFRSVSITLEHGHDQAPDLTGLVLQKVLAALASPMGATSEQAGQMAVRWGRTGLSLDRDQLQMLAPYRLQAPA
ncbi:MAG: hypothetical protein Q3999_05110 [Buchananella hordeovulneris]|nr:hypothetical protein [Buchananella hordeovulneris]